MLPPTLLRRLSRTKVWLSEVSNGLEAIRSGSIWHRSNRTTSSGTQSCSRVPAPSPLIAPIENNIPYQNFTLYQDTSDVAIAGLATSLAGVWLYGAKTEHHHARETGELELETNQPSTSFFRFVLELPKPF